MQYRLGFIGAGNMAEAIVRGAIESNVLEAGAILAADPTEERRDVFASLGVAVSADTGDVVARCEQMLLAVKPQVFPKLAGTLSSIDRDSQIVISIMAGVKSVAIEAATGGPTSIIRVMPNTPLMVGAGMSALARCGRSLTTNSDDASLCVDLFRGCGEVTMVSEDNLDAVTAVSGSGPAYVFLLAEAMAEAAVEMGLGGCHDLLVQQTILGAAKLMLESDESPEALRRKVTSPGGTTQAAIESFQASGFEEIVTKALRAARDRSVELGG
ncbi:MAG: pyrroline-5-carboxylate reductase [Planctomycetota bacterium]